MCWWWRKVRPAPIPKIERDVFERFGEAVIVGILTSGLNPPMPELQTIYNNPEFRQHAADWLTERGDYHEQREQRLETVEWAILIFVILGVVADFALAFGWFNSR